MKATSLPAAGIDSGVSVALRALPARPSAPWPVPWAVPWLAAAAASDALARLTEAQVTRQAPWPVELAGDIRARVDVELLEDVRDVLRDDPPP
jgi:hypothetical protein